MGLLIYGLRSAGVVPANLPLAAELLALVLVGAASYFVFLYALDRSGFRAVRAMAWQVAVPRSARARLAGLEGVLWKSKP